MNVIAYDPFLSEDKAKASGIKKVSLEDLFARSDFITIHTPMTPETKGIINSKTTGIVNYFEDFVISDRVKLTKSCDG